jgi:hypothetical protein
MNVRISCPFVIKNSGSANSPGFFGDNTVELAPFKQEGLLGLGGTNIEVSLLSHRRYLLEVVSDCLPDESGQIDYLKKVAEYLSFLLNRDESNPHFGNSFVSLDWYEFASIPSPEAGDHINDQVQVNSGIRLEAKFRVATMREVAFSDRHDKDRRHHDVLRFYFGGLSAEDKKSKYFHWFLVLECLEHSPGYKQRFSRKLFDSEEEQRLRKIAGELNDDSKKSAILGLLARTKYSRSRKLFEFVRAVGLIPLVSAEIPSKLMKA